VLSVVYFLFIHVSSLYRWGWLCGSDCEWLWRFFGNLGSRDSQLEASLIFQQHQESFSSFFEPPTSARVNLKLPRTSNNSWLYLELLWKPQQLLKLACNPNNHSKLEIPRISPRQIASSPAAKDHQLTDKTINLFTRHQMNFPQFVICRSSFHPRHYHSGHPQAFVGHLHRHPSPSLTANKLYKMTNSSNKNKCFSFFFNLNLFSFFTYSCGGAFNTVTSFALRKNRLRRSLVALI
jgi:hypothetical protein